MPLILNFSGLCHDSGLHELLSDAAVVDFSSLGGTNCYVDADSYAAMRSALGPYPAMGVHWIDTGDYHYATRLFLEKLESPFALLMLDHHPDMQKPVIEMLSCGSWLRDSLETLPMLRHAAVVGISRELEGECVGFSGRVSVFPEKTSWTAGDVAAAIPRGLPLYVSLDKDVFASDYARTDWDQGCMSLEYCREIIDAVSVDHEIIGADICGGLTVSKGALPEDFIVNNFADKFLFSLLEKKIRCCTFED